MPAPVFLDRRTGHRAVGTEHAAIAGFGLQQDVAALAFVEPLAGVGGHGLGLDVAALGAGQGGLQDGLGTHAVDYRKSRRRRRVVSANSLNNQPDRFDLVALRQHAADARRMRVAGGAQRGEAGFRLVRRHTGEQAAGGLRIEQQRVVRVPGGFFLVGQRPAQAQVGGLQGTQHAGRDAFGGAGQQRQRGQVEFRIDARWLGHLDQVAEQAEAGEVGAGRGAVRGQAGHRGAVG